MSKLLFALSFVSFVAFAGVGVARDGNVIRVKATIAVAVKPDLAWAVLTDYNHLADFVPDLLLSHVISSEPLHVEQKGENRFSYLSLSNRGRIPGRGTVASCYCIQISIGQLKNMRGEWRITQKIESEIELGYSATMETDFWSPPGHRRGDHSPRYST